jgi:hypothetical protein
MHKRGSGLAFQHSGAPPLKGIAQALDQIGLIGLILFHLFLSLFHPQKLILLHRQTSEVTSGRKMTVVNPIRRWTVSL